VNAWAVGPAVAYPRGAVARDPRDVVLDALVEELARVYWEDGRAQVLVLRAGFPTSTPCGGTGTLGPQMSPPASPEQQRAAIQGAQGNLLHAVKLHELWSRTAAKRSPGRRTPGL
jgi:hypothetical protein